MLSMGRAQTIQGGRVCLERGRGGGDAGGVVRGDPRVRELNMLDKCELVVCAVLGV